MGMELQFGKVGQYIFVYSVVVVVSNKAQEDWGKKKEELWMNAKRNKGSCMYVY